MNAKQSQLDELMPKMIRKGLAAALTTAQDVGLITFGIGVMTGDEVAAGVERVIGSFIDAMSLVDPTS